MDAREGYAGAMREGHLHAWAGRWREAAAAYRRAVSALPDDPAARSSLAAALAHVGNPEEALGLFDALAAERPDDTAVALRVAELRQRLGRMEEADDAYLTVASLYAGEGQPEKARRVWQRLIETSGHRADAMRRVADASAAAGAADLAARARVLAATAADTVVARARADAAARQAEQPDPLADVAATLRERGLVRAAYRTAEPVVAPGPSFAGEDDALAALAADPFDLPAARRLGLGLRARESAAGPLLLTDAADVAELAGDLGLAVELIGDAIPRAPDPVPLYRRIVRLALVGEAVEVAADAHLAIARLALERQDSATAAAEARRARAVAPVSPRIHGAAAELLRPAGDDAEADDAVRRAFQLAPRDAGYAVAYAVAAARRGALDEANVPLDAIDRSVDAAAARAAVAELVGEAPVRSWVRGRILEAIGDPAAEAELAAAAAAAAPLGPCAAAYVAQRRFERGDAAGALDLLRPWLRTADGMADLDDGDRERIAGLALSAAEAVGDLAAAAASLRVLAAGRPDDEPMHALLAERLAASGEVAAAAGELARLADRRREAGDLDGAAGLLEGALALTSDDAGLLKVAADIALARGDREGARQRYVAAADAADGDGSLAALLAAAELSAWGGRVDLLRRAVDRYPEQIEPRRRLVAALVASGQASQAAAESAELAGLLQASGDRAGALAALDQARKLDPWNAGLAAVHRSFADGERTE